jgi:heme/copper-type cytochrome/quinol oxidase subunit 4
MAGPPTRDATGRRLRSTTVVNSVMAVGIAAIPIGIAAIGLVGGRSAATVVLGIGFAEFGLIAFALYSFVWVATRRATLAATVALIVAGIVAILLALPAFLDQLAGRNPF